MATHEGGRKKVKQKIIINPIFTDVCSVRWAMCARCVFAVRCALCAVRSAQGSGRRAQGAGRRAQDAGRKAQDAWAMGWNPFCDGGAHAAAGRVGGVSGSVHGSRFF